MAIILDLPVLWIILIEVISSTIIGVVLTFSAFYRYRKRKNHLSKIVFVTLLLSTIAFAFTILGEWSYIALVDIGIFVYVPYFFTTCVLYFWFTFSRIVFLGEHEHTKIEKIVLIMVILTIGFGFMRYYAPLWFGETSPITVILTLGRIVLLLAFEGLVNAIVIVGAFRVKGRIPKEDPFQPKMTDIIIIAIAALTLTVLYLLDTIIFTMTLVLGTWAFVGGVAASSFFMIYIYRTFFTQPRIK